MLKGILIGNLGSDPEEIRYNANGRPFTRFNVASNFRARTPEGEMQDKTEWVRVVASGPRAEFCVQYLRKGMRVFADGRLEASPWIDQQQQPRAGLTLFATDVEFMTNRADDEAIRGAGPRAVSDDGPPPARPAPARGPAPQDEGELEDLPF